MTRLEKDAANRLLLRKQHLSLGARSTPSVVMRDLIGLHATDATSPYLQLYARVDGFQAHSLDRLLEHGEAARVACMRGTLFLQPADLIPLVLAATRRVLLRGRDRYLAENGLTSRRYRQLASRVIDALAGRTLDARQIRRVLSTREALPAVLHLMCDDASIVRWKGVAGWSDRRHSYRILEEALPKVDLTVWDEEDAIRELVRRYIVSYGPVSERDIAWWTGFDRATVRDALVALDSEVATAEVEGVVGRLLVHCDERMKDRRRSGVGPEVSLVPILDPYLQGYKDRDRYVRARDRDYVFDPKGNSMSAVLVDGAVVGVWDVSTDPRTEIRLYFLTRLPSAVRRRVFTQASKMASFLFGDRASVLEVADMIPLKMRSGWISSPLKGSRPRSRLNSTA